MDTIAAIATASGQAAIGVIRLSGPDSIRIADDIFLGAKLNKAESHSLHYGKIMDGEQMLDEVLISLFRNPASYTGDDIIEISAHGSTVVLNSILDLCLQKGARLAKAGEFTQRAFLNGKLDLSQAEAVADLIASENKAQHQMAVQQMRGGYSEQISNLRQELIDFAALLELELDFSEEDVEFANRDKFLKLIDQTQSIISNLIESFAYGNVIKNGIAVAIVGAPNVGKSTLLNKLFNEERAIVSATAGTTRDFIEDTLIIDGLSFRFIDTAGIRETKDDIEQAGIDRSFEQMKKAQLVLFLADINDLHKDIAEQFKALNISANGEQEALILLNKSDLMVNCNAYDVEEAVSTLTKVEALEISAESGRNMDQLKKKIANRFKQDASADGLVVSNLRHLEALKKALESLVLVRSGLEKNIGAELVSIDVRTALEALGSITGQISSEDILGSIFSRFCIGK